jgi:glycosyltransferase involved in cell wall biosynthesis
VGGVSELLAGRDVVCISSIGWPNLWQAHQEISIRLARDGSRVVYIENIGARRLRWSDRRRVLDRLRDTRRGVQRAGARLDVISPLVMPPFGSLARVLNRRVFLQRLARTIEARDPIVWTFLPTDTALDLYDRIATPASRLVYYCVADFPEVAHEPLIRGSERAIVERADVVFANRDELAARFRPWNANVHVFPVGVSLEAFTPGVAVADAVARLPRPRIGCIGSLHEMKNDFAFLAEIARLRPEWSWIYVGQQQSGIGALDLLPNVHLEGEVPHGELASHIEGFDVCIVPYRETDLLRTAVPTKINEYLAMGKPVVATPSLYANELQAAGAIDVAPHEPQAFVAAIERCLGAQPDGRAARRRELAARADWSSRLAEMCGIVRATM